jgi:hypothetical protein
VRGVLAELRAAVGADSSLGSLRPRLVTPAGSHGALSDPSPQNAPGQTLLVDLVDAAPRPPRRFLYVLATAAGLSAAGVVAFGLGGRSAVEPAAPPEVVENVAGPPSGDESGPAPAAAAVAPRPFGDRGRVEIETNVDDAAIWVDQKKQHDGVSNATVSLSEGEHTIAVSAPGKRREERRVQVAAGVTLREEFQLKPAQLTKRLEKGREDKKDRDKDKKDDRKPKPGKDRDSLIVPF